MTPAPDRTGTSSLHGPSTDARTAACRNASLAFAYSGRRGRVGIPVVILVTLAALVLLTVVPKVAFAGKSSAGQLLFYPCTTCHPLASHPDRPNNFKKHDIKLIVHDVLGKGGAACLVCHDSAQKNPGMLKLIDGSLVPITRNASLVCYRCHSNKYLQWKAGIHGKRPSCTASGCHDPHNPQWIGIRPLLPFLGTSIEVKAVGERRPFKALPGPPAHPEAPRTPLMPVASVLAVFGIAAAFTLASRKRSVHGRP